MPHRAEHAAEDVRWKRLIAQPKRPMWRKRLPRQLPPNGIVLEYYKAIRGYLDRAREMVDRRVVPRLAEWVAEAQASREAFDSAARLDRDDANRVIDGISKDYFDQLQADELERRARAFGERTTDFQRAQYSKQVRAAFGVDVFRGEPRVGARVGEFVSENVALIKSIPNQYFDQVEAVVTRGVRQGTRHEELAKEIAERFEVSKSRAALVARDQVLTAYADVNRIRQEAMGVKRFTWKSVGDGRVRPEHEERDGQTFSWDDLPDGEGPGDAVLCRCWAEPDFSDILANL